MIDSESMYGQLTHQFSVLSASRTNYLLSADGSIDLLNPPARPVIDDLALLI